MGQKRSGISHCGTLDALNVPSRVSGRVTAQLKMALPGVFHSETATPIGKEAFSKHRTRTAKRIILESVKKLEELFIAPTARQILHETAQRAFARCECA